jgi:hypothetical protein
MTAGTRRQRQREAVVAAAAAGDAARATALLAEHVVEFPDDAGILGASRAEAAASPRATQP